MRRFVPRLTFFTLATSACAAALAARPFITDDARVVDPDSSQVEAFVKRQRNVPETELWILPAHNFASLARGRIELGVGAGWTRSAPSGDARSLVAQAKTLLKPLETNGSGYALTIGVTRTAPSNGGPETNPYLNGIGSFSFADDLVVAHANLGARHDAAAGNGTFRATWGVGSEVRLLDRLYGLAELYGERGEKPTRHAGLRAWIVPNRVQVDSTVGVQKAAPEQRFFTVGMRLLW